MCLITDSFKASHTKTSRWVVDSRATDHMIHDISFFDSYKPTLGNQKITVVDGCPANIAGQGTLHLTPSISLKMFFIY